MLFFFVTDLKHFSLVMITRKLRPLWLTSRRCKNISLAIWSCFAIVIAPLRFRGLHGQTVSLHFEEAHFDYFPSYHITPDHWDPMTHIHLYCSWIAQHSCGQKLQQLPLDGAVFSKLYSDFSSILKDFRNADYNFKNTSSYLINQGNVVAYHFIPISSTLAV